MAKESINFDPISSKKIIGIIFLSFVLVAVVYVVTSGKYNMNPNKSAAMLCQGTCYRANLCDSLDRQTAVGSCSTGYVCCGAKYGGSTPTPAPTATPKTPTPTSCSNDKRCTSLQKGYKRCYDGFIIEKCDGKCWQTETNCGGHNGLDACFSYNNEAQCSSVETHLITSGTCNEKCLSKDGVCLGVGTNDWGSNNKIMSWGDWTKCIPRSGKCSSTVKQLQSGGRYCDGHPPEWTICSCVVNPFMGK